MMNLVTLVGRLAKEPTQNEYEGKKYCIIDLAVPRSFKNEEGIYETDFIKVVAYGNMAQSTLDYCRKGDLISIKGRIETDEDRNIKIIADKVSFLSSKPKEENSEN